MNDSNQHDVTQDLQATDDAALAELPQRIGRYPVQRVMGQASATPSFKYARLAEI